MLGFRHSTSIASLFRGCMLFGWVAILLAATAFAQPKSSDDFPPTHRKEVGTSWKVSGTVSSTNSRPLANVTTQNPTRFL